MTLDGRTEQARAVGVRQPVRPEAPAKKRQSRKPKRSKNTRTKGTRAKSTRRTEKTVPAASTAGPGRGPAPVWALGKRSAKRYAAQARESTRTPPLATATTATTATSPVALVLDGAQEGDEERTKAATGGPDGPATAGPPAPESASVDETGREGRRGGESDVGGSRTVGMVGGPPAADPAALAFDFLHTSHAATLARQAYLLTGNREVARWAVARAFHLAWERWPEVARDPDPAGWVRAATYECALSPWLRFWPGRNRPEAYAGPPEHRLFLETFWRLPRTYRRTLLLHDGLGLDLAETAAETEASTPATVGRLRHTRAALATAIDTEGREAGGDGVGSEGRGGLVPRIRAHLEEAAAAHEVRSEAPRAVRAISETVSRRLTLGACGLTAVLVGMTSFTIATTESGSLLPTDVPAAVAELAR